MLDKEDTLLKIPVADKARGKALSVTPSSVLPLPLLVVELGWVAAGVLEMAGEACCLEVLISSLGTP